MESARARGLWISAAGAVAVGLGAGAWAMADRPDAAAAAGEALQIAVFSPPPPAIQPGGVLEVGDLNDGYVHVPPPARDAGWTDVDLGWWDEIPAETPREATWVGSTAPTPASVEPAPETDSMGLGFEPVAVAERRVIRAAPSERAPPTGGDERRPEPVMATGERDALFY